jgi:hypothetical protein
LPLSADADGPDVRWSSSTLEIDAANAVAQLVPGTHQIQALHVPSGQVRTVRVVVRGT